jgi:hypothetical protein
MALGNAHGRDQRAPFTQSIFTSHYHHQAQEALVMCTIQTSQVALDANSACETTGFISILLGDTIIYLYSVSWMFETFEQ